MTDVQEICSVLTREPLKPGQITLLKALYETDMWLSVPDLKQLILTWRGADDATLRGLADSVKGVLGGLGLRVNQTPHLRRKAGIELLFNTRPNGGVKQYRMKPELRTVIDSLPQLTQVLHMTVEDIQRSYRNGIQLSPSSIC